MGDFELSQKNTYTFAHNLKPKPLPYTIANQLNSFIHFTYLKIDFLQRFLFTGETSGQSEPLLSSSLDEPPQTALAFPNEQTVTEMELIGYSKINKDPLLNQKEEVRDNLFLISV